MLLNLIRVNWIVITLLLLAIITVASLWPLEKLPRIPGGDKTHHLLAYAALMFPTALRKPKYWLYVALFFIGWGGAIEMLQPYMNRYADWWDVAANATGIFLGLLSVHLLGRVFPVDTASA